MYIARKHSLISNKKAGFFFSSTFQLFFFLFLGKGRVVHNVKYFLQRWLRGIRGNEASVILNTNSVCKATGGNRDSFLFSGFFSKKGPRHLFYAFEKAIWEGGRVVFFRGNQIYVYNFHL